MSERTTPDAAARFRLGINYWPGQKAMGWWRAFDRAEVRADFAKIAAVGFDSVRIFLTWEDFQPDPKRIDVAMVERLISTLEQAEEAGLSVMPTLFTGHMSGVNWIPPWALGKGPADARFRVVSGGAVARSSIASWYDDATVVEAQSSLARELASALAGHAALWAWDLGNENSNCSVPAGGNDAHAWLRRMCESVRSGDAAAKITVGLHMEDLEQDRKLGPHEAAQYCDFLTMHGYPGYAAWADEPTDERVLPFLTELTRWLGGGANVLFSEFGVPTAAEAPPGSQLVREQQAADYVARSLRALVRCGSTGAMLWCYSDYAQSLWKRPPFDRAHHERSFGLWRTDGSPKPSVAVVEAFASGLPTIRDVPRTADVADWIDVAPGEFYGASESEVPRLYRRYCEQLAERDQASAAINVPG